MRDKPTGPPNVRFPDRLLPRLPASMLPFILVGILVLSTVSSAVTFENYPAAGYAFIAACGWLRAGLLLSKGDQPTKEGPPPND